MFHFDLEGSKIRVAQLEGLTYEEDFWKDVDKAQSIMQEAKAINNEIKEYEDLLSDI